MLSLNELKSFVCCSKKNEKFILLPQLIGDLPSLSSDMLGEVTYYSFLNAGILILVDDTCVSQISLFIEGSEGFSPYTGKLPFYGDNESSIVKELGIPLKSGGGKPDALLGYLNRWVKYELEEGYLHLEFNQNGELSKVTLMGE